MDSFLVKLSLLKVIERDTPRLCPVLAAQWTNAPFWWRQSLHRWRGGGPSGTIPQKNWGKLGHINNHFNTNKYWKNWFLLPHGLVYVPSIINYTLYNVHCTRGHLHFEFKRLFLLNFSFKVPLCKQTTFLRSQFSVLFNNK